MMRYKHQGWGIPLACEAVKKLQKMFAGYRVEAGAGFIENQ